MILNMPTCHALLQEVLTEVQGSLDACSIDPSSFCSLDPLRCRHTSAGGCTRWCRQRNGRQCGRYCHPQGSATMSAIGFPGGPGAGAVTGAGATGAERTEIRQRVRKAMPRSDSTVMAPSMAYTIQSSMARHSDWAASSSASGPAPPGSGMGGGSARNVLLCSPRGAWGCTEGSRVLWPRSMLGRSRAEGAAAVSLLALRSGAVGVEALVDGRTSSTGGGPGLAGVGGSMGGCGGGEGLAGLLGVWGGEAGGVGGGLAGAGGLGGG
mmetsp:Transcript_8087/g.20900  ORF Transcript_8087/g.20900 Transcript_8087/m.20900 type:complete len:266 (-) Transcript_8087:1177-1974(-)